MCALSGRLPQPYCPHRLLETFIAGTQPQERCDLHRQVTTHASGDDSAESPQVVTVLPAEAQAWADERGLRRPVPSEVRQEAVPVRLVHPPPGQQYRLAPDLPREAQGLAVAAGVSADLEVEVVRLLVDGEVLAEVRQPPYRAVWVLQTGSHRFQAEASAGGTTYRSEEVTVTVAEASDR